jgi:hypothetical protein
MKLKGKHRVRFVQHSEYEIRDEEKIFWKAADKFKEKKEKAEWVERNGIKLEYDLDYHMGRHAFIYADLDDDQYTDYVLNFYEHESEDWK